MSISELSELPSLDPKVDFAADQLKSGHGIVLWVLHPALWSRDDLCITGGVGD